jgi:glutamyl-tRNA reductase
MLSTPTSLDVLFNQLGALVLTHKYTSTEDVGRNHLSKKEQRGLASSVPPEVELVVLQTCNRVEVYFHGDYEETLKRLIGFLKSSGKPVNDPPWRILSGSEVVEHLFRVAAGLESLSVGENEILGQVRDAYAEWRRIGRVGHCLSTLFDRALHVGKRVRTETRLSKGKTGLYSLAVSYASQLVDLRSSRVAVVGAGKVCSKLVKMMRDLGVEDVTVFNRTVSRAAKLASKYGYSYGALRFEVLDGYDVVFSAITTTSLRSVRGPRLVVDLSVPPAFSGGNVVYLEQLGGVASKNAESKRTEVSKAENIIREEEQALIRHLRQRLADSYISKITLRLEAIRRSEVRRALSILKQKGVSPAVSGEVLDGLTRSIINKTFYRVLEDIKLLTYQGDMDHVKYLLSLFGDDSNDGETRLQNNPPSV